MTVEIVDLVHQLENGRWIVAYQSGDWYAPMTDRERKATGCHTLFAKRIEDLGATSYAHRSDALRRARQYLRSQEH